MSQKEELLPNPVLIHQEKQEVPGELKKYSCQLQLYSCYTCFIAAVLTSIAAALLIRSVHSNRCCCFTMGKIFAEMTTKVVKHVDHEHFI